MKQYRVVGLGNYFEYYSHFLYSIMEGTIRNGHLFRAIPLFGQNLNAVKEQIAWFKPHIIIGHMFFNRQPHNMHMVFDMLRQFKRQGVQIFYHAGDARETPRYPENISTFVSASLINHWPPMPEYNKWCVPMYHWPYMCLYQKEVAEPVDMFKCQLAFTGSVDQNEHHAPRARFIQSLMQKMDVKLFPTPQTGNTRFQTPELSISAGGVLGFQMGLGIPGYLDVRPFQYTGAGALFFHDHSEAMNKFFVDGVHYVGFKRDNVDDFYEKWKLYVQDNPKEGLKIRDQAFKYAQNNHSAEERMRGVFDIFEGKNYNPNYWQSK